MEDDDDFGEYDEGQGRPYNGEYGEENVQTQPYGALADPYGAEPAGGGGDCGFDEPFSGGEVARQMVHPGSSGASLASFASRRTDSKSLATSSSPSISSSTSDAPPHMSRTRCGYRRIRTRATSHVLLVATV
jgi:hypothetical protein|eukprot:gene6905-biopygen13522